MEIETRTENNKPDVTPSKAKKQTSNQQIGRHTDKQTDRQTNADI